MSITLHLEHALGKHTYVAAPRGLDAPVVAGRGPRCDVVVPSAAVSIKHLAVFVFRGRWAAQDLHSRNGTFLNGAALQRPTYLKAGDVLALGREESPPTLTVEAVDADAAERWVPATASVSKPARASASAASSASSAGAASVSGFPSSAVTTADADDSVASDAGGTAVFAAASPLPEARAFEPAAVEAPHDPLLAAAAVAPRRRRRRRRRASVVPTLAVLALVTAVVGAGAWQVYRRYGPPSRAAVETSTPAPAAPTPAVVDGKKGLFERAEAPKPKPPAAKVPAESETPRVAPPDEGGAFAAGPTPAQRAWAQVLDAGRLSPPKVSLWLLIQYRSTYPDALPADFATTESGLLDRLWWERVASLALRRKTLAAAFDVAEKDVVQTPLSEVDRRTQLAAKRDDLKQQLADVKRTLVDEMEFGGEGLVDPSDDAQLAALRKGRDASLFRDWSDRVEGTLRRTAGGRLPW